MSQTIVSGGGAAGYFAAIAAAESGESVTLFEQSQNPLGKVKISGGGRCNVTHNCIDPAELIKHYPRGGRELLGPFHKFGVKDTIEWFESRGVKLKTEGDGRMFPVTDDSQTIIDCLEEQARMAGVKVLTSAGAEKIIPPAENGKWKMIAGGKTFEADKIIVATGSSPKMWKQLAELGHTIIEPVPSLFTFNIADERIKDLMGLSVENAIASVAGTKLKQRGPLLITHWGMSGPAILKLSAWGARELHQLKYIFPLQINWTGQAKEEIQNWIIDRRKKDARKQIENTPFPGIPQRLWNKLILSSGVPAKGNWADASMQQMNSLMLQLSEATFSVKGKSTFKEEFVTAGGVKLNEVDFKTMQSKLLPGLFFAGEVLDIDAVTGGFNFQAAWTTGFIAGRKV